VTSRRNVSTFIVNLESQTSDAEMLDVLERLGLNVDREYGLVPLDPKGLQRVARVSASEGQMQEAQATIGFTYYPDLSIRKLRR
jgi:hypothetical protein